MDCLFCTLPRFSLLAACLFSRPRLRGTQGGRLYTTAQVWVQAGLRGACSRSSKSRELASNHGIAFRRARAEHDNGTPHNKNEKQIFAFSLLCLSTSVHVSQLAPRLVTWLPSTSSVVAWPPGQLAPRPSSRATAVTLRARFFEPRCFSVCTSVFEDDKWKHPTNSGPIGFASGIQLCPFIDG